jgi:hypothetical protein
MKISKSFVMRISGNYQTYEFQTGIEYDRATGDLGFENKERKDEEDVLFEICKQSVNRDIASFAAEDQNFRTVLLSRDKELEKAATIHNKNTAERKSVLDKY